MRIRLPRQPMPRYTYRCDKCENILETAHSIKEKLEICEECDGELIRIPSEISMKFKAPTATNVGDIVKTHIEESRKELKQEQRRISVEEYK